MQADELASNILCRCFGPYKNIQPAVVIKIGPGGGLGGMKKQQAAGYGYIGKSAIAIIAQQRTWLVAKAIGKPCAAQHKQIDIAIVIIIGLLNVKAAGYAFKAACFGPVGKCSVFVILEIVHRVAQIPGRK
jgi:hypothetical protein